MELRPTTRTTNGIVVVVNAFHSSPSSSLPWNGLQTTMRTSPNGFITRRTMRFGSFSPTTRDSPRGSSRPLSRVSSSQRDDDSFPTWTYDKPCTTCIPWSWDNNNTIQLKYQKVKVNRQSSSMEELLQADLILFGVYYDSPLSKEEEDEDEHRINDNDDDGRFHLTDIGKELDETILKGALSQFLREQQVPELGTDIDSRMTTPVLCVSQNKQTYRYAVLGLGPKIKSNSWKDTNSQQQQQQKLASLIGQAIANTCHNEHSVETCSVLLPKEVVMEDSNNNHRNTFLKDISVAFYETLYLDNRYTKRKSKDNCMAENLKQVTIYDYDSSAPSKSIENKESLSSIKKESYTIAKGVSIAKDIVNSPHNVLNSLSFANTAKYIALHSHNQNLKCNILNQAKCEQLNMGAYLAVARGSETEPQFIHLTYQSPPPTTTTSKKKKKNDNKIVLGVVGKGLLFDTGGYNIKTEMMEEMKADCGGAAAVLGAAYVISELQPSNVEEVHFIIPACENMINSKSYVPSDIVIASNNKTIEIVNTDAEGRLTLADAIVYAEKVCKCNKIIELSTLTGSCEVALGKKVAGYWTSNEKLAKEIYNCSVRSGEPTWRMPLIDTYNDQLKSNIADITNLSPGPCGGGAITAALFLENFVNGHKIPFAHCDIAGPAWDDKIGGTGYGTKLITEWILCQ